MDNEDLNCGEYVYVPCNCAPEFSDCHEAMVRAEILAIEDQNIRVNVGQGQESNNIPKEKIHKNAAILILCLGDIVSEENVLDPLAKSILHYCRLLHKDPNNVRYLKTRSSSGLKDVWDTLASQYKIVIFISHGCATGFTFGKDHYCAGADELINSLNSANNDRKLFISLSCQTGSEDFGSRMSSSQFCNIFIGPNEKVHGALASQFCQTLLANYLMDGTEITEAFETARSAIPGTNSFRLFIEGQEKTH